MSRASLPRWLPGLVVQPAGAGTEVRAVAGQVCQGTGRCLPCILFEKALNRCLKEYLSRKQCGCVCEMDTTAGNRMGKI